MIDKTCMLKNIHYCFKDGMTVMIGGLLEAILISLRSSLRPGEVRPCSNP